MGRGSNKNVLGFETFLEGYEASLAPLMLRMKLKCICGDCIPCLRPSSKSCRHRSDFLLLSLRLVITWLAQGRRVQEVQSSSKDVWFLK